MSSRDGSPAVQYADKVSLCGCEFEGHDGWSPVFRVCMSRFIGWLSSSRQLLFSSLAKKFLTRADAHLQLPRATLPPMRFVPRITKGQIARRILALAEVIRQPETARTNALITNHADAAQKAWARVWPDALAEIMQLAALDRDPTEANARGALTRAGQHFDDWLTEADQTDLIEATAGGFGLGHTAGREGTTERSTGQERVRCDGHGPPGDISLMLRQVDDEDIQPRPIKPSAVSVKLSADEIFEIWGDELAVALEATDERAAAWLAKDSVFWVGSSWSQDLGRRISSHTIEAVRTGLSRRKLAEKLRERLTQFNRPESYWRTVASAGIVRSRSMGFINSAEAAGVRSVSWSSSIDSRTSAICRELDGRVYSIEIMTAHRDRMLDAESPEDVKDVAPWVPVEQLRGKSAEDLAAEGFGITPPAHGRCRSVLIVEDVGGF